MSLDTGLNVVLSLSAAALAFCLSMLLRNSRVHKFRLGLIDKVSSLARQDIQANRSYHWRYSKLDEISYHEMMWKFWKPLRPEAWWDDTSFLE